MQRKDKHMKEIVKDMDILHTPDGFTQRVMNRVMAEPRHSTIAYRPLIKPVTLFVFLFIFAGFMILAYFLSDPSSPEAGSFFGLTITLPPIHDWVGKIFEPFSRINASPVIVTVSVLMLFTLILADEFILKKIYQKR